MEIKYNTKNLKEMTDIYELARGVFHHLDYENIEIDFELAASRMTGDPDGLLEHNSVTISWSSKPGYQDYLKLELLNNLIERFVNHCKEK